MDGTEERKDTSQGGDSSSEQTETSETPQTYTKESEAKAIEDALSAAGRGAKTITDLKAEAKEILETAQGVRVKVKEERDLWQNHRDEADREAVKEDPAALKSVQERQRQARKATELTERTQELDAKEAKQKEKLEKADKIEAKARASEIATKHNVDAESLTKFTDGSREAMEELAQKLPTLGEKKKPLKTDSSTTEGGGASPKTGKAKMRSGWDAIHKT